MVALGVGLCLAGLAFGYWARAVLGVAHRVGSGDAATSYAAGVSVAKEAFWLGAASVACVLAGAAVLLYVLFR